MRVQLRSGLAAIVIGFTLFLSSGSLLRAQEPAPAATSPTGAQASPVEKPDAANDNDEFRHAPMVKKFAGMMHVSTETAAQIFEDVNSAILIGLILYFLVKVVPKAFRNRSETIQKQLTEARAATEEANARLSAVEAKLERLGEDIDQVRKQTEIDLIEDEKRIRQSLEDERVRIVKAAEQEIDSAAAGAHRELKRFAAGLAFDKAVQSIQLTSESDKAIVQGFGKDLVGRFGNGGRN